MTTPTPAEITAAAATLRRIPGVTDNTQIGAVATLALPEIQFARALHEWLNETRYRDVGGLLSTVEDLAARHGLRITTDPAPGKLLGYRRVIDQGGQWDLDPADQWFGATDNGLAAAASGPHRVAAVYLLPEGDKS